jgi:hypothetical protein
VDEVEESAACEPRSRLSRSIDGRPVHIGDPTVDSDDDDWCRQMLDNRSKPGVDPVPVRLRCCDYARIVRR